MSNNTKGILGTLALLTGIATSTVLGILYFVLLRDLPDRGDLVPSLIATSALAVVGFIILLSTVGTHDHAVAEVKSTDTVGIEVFSAAD